METLRGFVTTGLVTAAAAVSVSPAEALATDRCAPSKADEAVAVRLKHNEVLNYYPGVLIFRYGGANQHPLVYYCGSRGERNKHSLRGKDFLFAYINPADHRPSSPVFSHFNAQTMKLQLDNPNSPYSTASPKNLSQVVFHRDGHGGFDYLHPFTRGGTPLLDRYGNPDPIGREAVPENDVLAAS